MRNLKKIATALVAVVGLASLVAVFTATAHPGWQGGGSGAGGPEATDPATSEIWQHMNEMRTIMHNATATSEPISDGVRVIVTGEGAELVAAIQEEFGKERPQLDAPYPGTEVTVESLENGIALTFTAPEPETVQWLQSRGTALFYSILRDNMHEAMAGQGGAGWGHGPGMMGGGWGHGQGHGRWMMGGGSGYGPGMRGAGGGW